MMHLSLSNQTQTFWSDFLSSFSSSSSFFFFENRVEEHVIGREENHPYNKKNNEFKCVKSNTSMHKDTNFKQHASSHL